MQSGVCPSVVRIGLYRPGNLGGRRAALAAGLMALALMLLAIVPSQQSAAAHPQAAGVKGATALARLESLPLQARSVISGALGSGAAAFAAEPRPGGYALAGGGVAANLNDREVTVQVSGGTLSLALSGVGRGVRLAAAGGVSPAANANRVTYRRAGVQEWYAAGPLGIEQGFTLTRRPVGTAGPVTLAVRLGGSLRAQLAGSQVQFLASSGGVGARYGGLTAVDASGRRLPATLAVDGRRLLLHVSDRGARYPLRIDPLIQQGPKLTASDETGQGEFGSSVAVSADGNTALIGAPIDNNSVGAGWVFTRSGGIWTQQGPKLTASDIVGGSFGWSVALSADGSTALIGGPSDTGVGAAWVFTPSGGIWTQQGPKVTASDQTARSFGWSVALSADGSTALIGAPRGDNNSVGAAWVFSSPPLVGSQQIQPNVDSNPAGTAEAFRYTAASTGSAGKLSIYLDSTSTATKVIVGLYTNTSAGNPGVLLTSGTITKPIAGAWNTVTVRATDVTAGTDYWLAVLAPFKAGTIKFRDLPDGTGGPTQTSAQKSLMSMPSSWKTGTRFANSPASLFAAP
jgi:hypothetical protein